MTIRIVLVDDQELFRAGLTLVLAGESDLTVVGEAASGEDGVVVALEKRPDVVVMDLRMPPGIGGAEATRRLVAATVDDEGVAPRVLMLTNFNAGDEVVDAVRAGAVGFVLKDSAPATLAAAIRAVAAGEPWLDPAASASVIRALTRTLDRAVPHPAAGTERLTDREVQIIRLIVRGRSNAAIAHLLRIEHSTVKTHVRNLFRKIGVRDRGQAAVYAFRYGYVSLDDTD